MEEYQINFEQVVLHESFGPVGPVYLFMRGTVYDPTQPEVALWSGSAGGLSPKDANVPADGETPTSEPFAPSLPVGAVVRNDGPNPARQNPYGPNFAVLPIPLASNERLRLELCLAPEVWFQTTHVPLSDWDRALTTIFLTAAGASGGVAGALVGALVGIFDPFSGSDPEVPCFNPILLETHEWDAAELRNFAGTGTHEYGPTGAPGGLGCPQARATYWLSAQTLGFIETPQAGCSVLNVGDEAAPLGFEGRWGDFGLTPSDQVNAWITRSSSVTDTYDVVVRERETASREMRSSFADVKVTGEIAMPWFFRNEYAFSPFGYYEAKPVSSECGSFTNLKQGTPWADLIFRLARIRRIIATELAIETGSGVQRGSEQRHDPRVSLGKSLEAPGSLLDDSEGIDAGSVIRSGPGGVSPLRSFTAYGAGKSGFSRRHSVWVLRLTPELVLMQYGEFHRGKMLTKRIRYLRTNASGHVYTDVLLRPTYDPPR